MKSPKATYLELWEWRNLSKWIISKETIQSLIILNYSKKLLIPIGTSSSYSPVGKVKRFLKIWKSLDHPCDILQISDTGIKEKFIPIKKRTCLVTPLL